MKDMIVHGYNSWLKKGFECNACGCIFTATPPDYKTVYVGDKKISFVSNCPYCGVDAYTAPEKIKEWFE